LSLDDDYADDVRGTTQPHRGVLILVLGILSLMVCGVLGIFAWMMGKRDLELIRSGQMDKEGEPLTKVGYILGIVGTILFILQLLLVAAYFVFFIVLIAAKK
jgi:hypothetical protein